ncbi:DUF5405 family protein [Escherichia coli]|nr:hypothetical protein [Escherichia coli]EFF1165929.1 hypothetical protein [Escherichia coli]EFF5461840.1 hypothetical protein [Escherichia coli]EKQ4277660.1 hypothetical protein [Escherichia coli]
MKLNIDLGKYVITGTKHDLILSERGIIKEGENAGKETLSRIGYYSKFEHLVKELCNREILLSQAQTLQDIQQHIETLGVSLSMAIDQFVESKKMPQTPATDAFLAEIRAAARNEGINYTASRLAAAFNHGFINKSLREVFDVTRMILSAKEELANEPHPIDGLSGEYAEKSLEEWAEQIRKGADK